MQVYISWAWAFSLPPFGVMRKNALQQWSRAVAAWFLRRLAFLLPWLVCALPLFFSSSPGLLFCPPFRCSSCPPVRVRFQEMFLVTSWVHHLQAAAAAWFQSFALSLSSVLIWRGGKEKEHAIFQVSSPSRILRLATAFRQAAVDRLEKRNNKNLAWQHLMLRWTTWWEWDQTCLGLGGWLPFRFLLTGNLLRYFRLHWDFFYFRVRYVCTYSTWYIYYL